MRSLLLVCGVLVILTFSLEGSHAANAASTYQVTLSYALIAGGNLHPPVLQYEQGGLVMRTPLSLQPTTYNIDLNQIWNASSLLPGSNSTERWALLGSSVGTGATETRVLVYYRQDFVTFSYTYRGNGQIFPLNHVNYTAFGRSALVYPPFSAWADYNSLYNYGNKSNYVPPGARWNVFEGSGLVRDPGTFIAGYFEQYTMNFRLSYLGPDTPGTTTLEVSYGGKTVNHTLTTTGGTFWLDYNSSFIAQPTIYGGAGSYRWFLTPPTSTVAYAPGDVVLEYVEQFPLSVTTSVSGGAEPSPPDLTATIDHQVTTFQLLPGNTLTWVDAESGYTVSNPLQGSSPSERWFANGATSGNATGPSTLSLEYFHQVSVPLSYSVTGGGSIPPFTAQYTSFGSASSVPVGLVPSDQWIDYGSPLGVPGIFAGSSQFERWALANPPGAALVPGAVSFAYYHQYYVPFLYIIPGQGNPPLASLNGTEFGVRYSWTLASGTSTWLDGDSQWSVSAFLPGIKGERWVGAGTLTGAVATGVVIDATYQHEYFVSVTSNPPEGGTLTGGGWATAGGVYAFSTTPNQGYVFAGWLGSGQGSYSGQRENYTGVVSGPVEESAQYLVGILVHVSGRGSVSVGAGTEAFTVGNQAMLYVPPGSTIALVANPGLLQTFSGWQGIPGGSAGAVSVKAETPLVVNASFTINQVEALGLITLCFGGAAFGILYLVTKRRPTTVFRSVNPDA